MFSKPEIRDMVCEALSNTSEWRAGKVDEYPDDERNAEASKLVSRLAEEVRQLPASAFEGLAFIYNRAGDDAFVLLSEHESEAMRAIGFRSFPKNGTEYVADLTTYLREAISTEAA